MEFCGFVSVEQYEGELYHTISYIFKKAIWGKGIGSRSVFTIVRDFIPTAVEEKIPFAGIKATCRFDNTASSKILAKTGMTHKGMIFADGAERHSYELSFKDIERLNALPPTEEESSFLEEEGAMLA